MHQIVIKLVVILKKTIFANMRMYIGLLLGSMIAFLSACSGYNKVLKSEDYTAKIEMANALFESKKFLRSVSLYEQIYQRYPRQEEGELAYFNIGKAHFEEKDYYTGAYYLGQFAVRFPYSKRVQEAMFLSALCSVYQSPEKSLDQTDTEIAINNLQQFIDRFSESELLDTSHAIMDKLRFKLESKDFDALQLYSRTMYYRAAVTDAINFMANYPMSIYREEAFYILVNNSYLLAKNSIESKKNERIEQTLERSRNFVAEFPESKYTKSVNNIINDMENEWKFVEN